MMPKIKTILPIALALLLPILNLFNNAADLDVYSLDFLYKWLAASLVLYLLWHILLFFSELKSKRRMFYLVLAIIGFIGLIYALLELPVFTHLNIRWVLALKLTSASLLLLIIQYALRASQDIAQLRIEKEQVQSENYRVQLQELRQRVDPHFLFNSMNTLRTMIRNQSPQAEEFVMNLSGFYRQTLRFNDSSVVSLQEEMSVLKSYLYLMQTRNEGKVRVEIAVDNAWLTYQIPTLSLQIVAENCFKHNQASTAHVLKIEIRSADDFYISIKNNIQPKFTTGESSGYGLSNIRKRYDLLGIEQGLLIEQTAEYFEVKLKLI